jgi:hypothetical protein
MIDRLKDLPPGVDGVRARGTVTKEDYQQVIEPILDEARSQGRRLRFLYHLGPEFEGFTPGTAWEDARVGWQYLRLFERCAVVSDIRWVREASRFMGALLPCPVEVFGNDGWREALAWLSAPTASTALTYRLLPESGVLVVEPRGPLRREDFDALALAVDPWIETHGELRGVVVHAQDFPGWEDVGGFLRHVRFVRDHHRKIRRIALAAGGRLAGWAPTLAEHFVQAEVKHFDYGDLAPAIAWASERAA